MKLFNVLLIALLAACALAESEPEVEVALTTEVSPDGEVASTEASADGAEGSTEANVDGEAASTEALPEGGEGSTEASPEGDAASTEASLDGTDSSSQANPEEATSSDEPSSDGSTETSPEGEGASTEASPEGAEGSTQESPEGASTEASPGGEESSSQVNPEESTSSDEPSPDEGEIAASTETSPEDGSTQANPDESTATDESPVDGDGSSQATPQIGSDLGQSAPAAPSGAVAEDNRVESNPDSEGNEISEKAKSLCQFIGTEISGAEGSGEANGLKLKGVVILARHGDRSPNHGEEAGELPGFCQPFREEDRTAFQEYREKVLSPDMVHFLHVDPSFYPFLRLPNPTKCTLGNLTAEGALQANQIGDFLFKQYEKTALFEGDAVNVTLLSSTYPRTFQTAVAYVQSLFFPRYNSEKFGRVYVHASPEKSLAFEEYDACPESSDIFPQLLEESLKYYEKEAPADLRKSTQDIADAIEQPELKEPLEVLDVLLGSFVCRRVPLPAPATYSIFDQLVDSATDRNTKLEADVKSILARHSAATALPVLQQIIRAGYDLQQNPESRVIRGNFGQFTTIVALLNALGLETSVPPQNGARLIFETYADDAGKILVRVLYNGEDVSANVKFAAESLENGLIPWDKFLDFVNKGIFETAGFADRNGLCGNDLTVPEKVEPAVAASPARAGDSPAATQAPGEEGASTEVSPDGGEEASTQENPEGEGASTEASPEGAEASTQENPEGEAASTEESPEGGEASTQENPEGDAASTDASPEGGDSSTQESPEGDTASTEQPQDGEASTQENPEGEVASTEASPEGAEESTQENPEGSTEASPEGGEASTQENVEGEGASTEASPDGEAASSQASPDGADATTPESPEEASTAAEE